MGNFRVVINAVGGHGQDREKKNGEIVDFEKGGKFTPEMIALAAVDLFREKGNTIVSAEIIHWPGEESEVKDDLLTGIREGNF